MNAENEAVLQTIRHAVRDTKEVGNRSWIWAAVSALPRGKRTRAGLNTGVFLQITCDDGCRSSRPEQKYTFGVVKSRQARGDFAVLAERGRRAPLRVHLGKDGKSRAREPAGGGRTGAGRKAAVGFGKRE